MLWFGWVRRHRRGRLQESMLVTKQIKWHRSDRRAGRELAADAEAFVNGRLIERADFLGVAVPVWEWTNLLAHGTEADLMAESKGAWSRWDSTIAIQWRRARSYLASEVLQYAELYGSLAEVQKTVLVPLELRLACDPEVVSWKPSRWALEVETALAQQHHVGHQG